MFKAGRWRSEKNKIKVVFKLEFHATKVTKLGWESVMLFVVPLDVGKPTSRSEKVTVMEGNCQWRKPIYETVKLIQDQKTGNINDKLYNFIVSATGLTKAAVIGEITINMSEYAEVFKPSTVSLPLKASESGPVLHVTIQRVQADVRRRDTAANGDPYIKEKENNISGQLDNTEDVSFTTYQMIIPSSKTMHKFAGSNKDVKKSSSIATRDTIVTDKISEQYMQKENGMHNHHSDKDYVSFESFLSSTSTPQKGTAKTFSLVIDNYRDHQRSFSVASGPEGSTDGSTKSLSEIFVQVSELELQTLRRQLVKETKHVHDLARELSRVTDERDAFRRECEEFKCSQKRLSNFDGEDPLSMLEEVRQELIHEKNLNANLRLQLQKTQESNSELILAVEDLEKVLEQQKNKDLQINEATSEEDSEQYALENLVKGHRDDMNVAYSLEQQIMDLQSEIKLYKKGREDLEMQTEQLALDYEILKQENHVITSKLGQSRLREQLRMQYECSAHTSIISDLEACIRNLQNELEEQAEAFEADVLTLTQAKIQQEQRAIQAEEVLRKARWNNANAAQQLQEEFEKLTAQMSSTFQMNEKIAMEALAEASELRLQKCRLEEELESVQGQCHVKIQDLSNIIAFKTKEIDKLVVELKEMSKELERLKNYEEAREMSFTEEISILKAEVERLSRENAVTSEELEKKRKLVAEVERLKASAKESEALLRSGNLERDALKKELDSIRKTAESSMNELIDLRNLRDKKETVMETLNSEVATLREQYNDLKHSVIEDELEKENLRKQVFQLRGDLRKKEDAITNIDKKLKDSNAKLAAYHETTKTSIRNKNNIISTAPQASKEVANLREKIKILEGKMKLKDAKAEDTKNVFLTKEKDLMSKIEELQKNLSEYRAQFCGDMTQKEGDVVNGKIHRVSMDKKSVLQPIMRKRDGKDGRSEEYITSTEETGLEDIKEYLISNNLTQDQLAEMLCKMMAIKEKNEAMDTELKEMQERYSEISLKFAEVEGERQQPVMTVCTLKNALNN